LEHAKLKPEELEPNNRNFEQEINSVIVQNADDDEATMRLYDISDRIEKDIYSKSKRDLKICDHCQKQFKGQVDENGNIFYYSALGKDGHYTFCSEECREKGMKDK